jgi:AraC family transcriptional regulator
MAPNDRTWKMPLDLCPTLHWAGVGVHGLEGVERFQVDFWCLHLYSYAAELKLDGEPFRIRPGYAGLTPPEVLAEYRFHGKSTHLFAHFSFPVAARSRQHVMPAMIDLGGDFDGLWKSLERGVALLAASPQRAVAGLWNVLWDLADRTGSAIQDKPTHPAVATVVGIVEEQMRGQLCVADLAKNAGVSHNHLTRLFAHSMGETVVAYIRKRRMLRARHLLLHSTRSIKSIAHEVGLPDLHAFNKTFRREQGCSPREFRQRSGSVTA